MAILYGNINILVYSDEEETNNPKSKILDIKEALSDSSINEFQPILLQMDGELYDTYQDINFNSINADYLFIFSDQPLKVKINGSASPIETTKLYLQGSQILSLSICNNSQYKANIRIGVGA